MRVAKLYESATGKPPTITTDWNTHKRGGDFSEFLEEAARIAEIPEKGIVRAAKQLRDAGDL